MSLDNTKLLILVDSLYQNQMDSASELDKAYLNLLYKSDALPEGGLLIPITGVELPKNLLIVQDQSLGSGYESHFYLEGIEATSYFLKIEPNKK